MFSRRHKHGRRAQAIQAQSRVQAAALRRLQVRRPHKTHSLALTSTVSHIPLLRLWCKRGVIFGIWEFLLCPFFFSSFEPWISNWVFKCPPHSPPTPPQPTVTGVCSAWVSIKLKGRCCCISFIRHDPDFLPRTQLLATNRSKRLVYCSLNVKEGRPCCFLFTGTLFFLFSDTRIPLTNPYIPTNLLLPEWLVCCTARLILLHLLVCALCEYETPHLHVIAAAEYNRGVIW